MKKIAVFVFLFLFAFSLNSFAASKYRGFKLLTGGTSDALDSVSVAVAENEDAAFVTVLSGTTVTRYEYEYDSDGTQEEDSVNYTVIRPDNYVDHGNWLLAKIHTYMLDSDLIDLADGITGIVKGAGDAGGFSAAVSNTDYAAASHAARHNDGGADEIDRLTEGITSVETETADGTIDVTNGTTQVVRLLESNANGTVTDFVDEDEGDHSEFVTGDWFIFRMTDASTVIDFSSNANIIGNCNTDFTGSATQFIDLLFRFQGTYWLLVNDLGCRSDPLTLAISSITTTETEFIPIAYMDDTAATNPAAAAIVTTTTYARKYNARAFDGATDENLTFNWVVPSDIDETSGIKFRVFLIADNADPPTQGDDATIEFELSGISIGANDTGDFAAFGSAQTSTWGDVTATAEDVLILAWSSAVTVTDLADGELVQFLLNRDANDGTNDAYDQDVNVIGIELKYKREHNATF